MCLLGLLSGVAGAGPWPAPIQRLADKGLTIVKRFPAPGGLEGFAARAGHTPVALYLTPDGQHVLVGTLLDASGKNLTEAQLNAAIGMPDNGHAWSELQQSSWIADGADDAPRVVYVFTDPNCGYCHKFYEESRPWVAAGKVQLRHIPVGVLEPSSLGKAAALLAADNPVNALSRHEQHYRTGGIKPLAHISDKLKHEIKVNTRLMARLEIHGTPGIVYRNQHAKVQITQGVPQYQHLIAVLGPR